ncbi:hypothetical protein BS17DRAFT_530648 [Gyrodon lividus]|nr:hypothetical protein BS17DRAFT_530648 [Gyrodon lividus]
MVNNGYSTYEIVKITQISKSTLQCAQKREQTTGSIAKAPAIGRGRPRFLAHCDILYLIRLAQHNPTLFFDEYAHRPHNGQFLDVSLATVHRTFQQAGINVKHVQKAAAERSPTLWADYI